MKTAFLLPLCALIALPVAAQDLAGPEPLTCLLAPNRTSDVGSDRTGIVTQVEVSRADIVRRGEVLVRLDDRLAHADITVAQIAVDALGAQIARSEGLITNNLIPIDELERLRTEFQLAQAELDRAELELFRTEILAPFDGIVTEVAVAPGELISAEPLLRMIDMTTLKAEMVFLDGAFGEIQQEDVVDLFIDLTGAETEGRITAIDPFLDPASNTFSVVAEIANPDLALPAGVSCRVTGWSR